MVRSLCVPSLYCDRIGAVAQRDIVERHVERVRDTGEISHSRRDLAELVTTNRDVVDAGLASQLDLTHTSNRPMLANRFCFHAYKLANMPTACQGLSAYIFYVRRISVYA